jgi:mediator of RNA polymerase II transcription subunit 5
MIESSQNMTSPVQWRTFFHQCLIHRIDANEFRNLSKLLFQKCPIAENALLDALLQTRSESRVKWDPLLPLYIDWLCRMGRVRTSTVLTSLLKYSSIHDKPQLPTSEGKDGSKYYTLMTDIRVIQDAMLSVSTGSTPKTNAEAIAIFFSIIDWIHAVVSWHNSHFDPGQHSSGMMSSPDVVSLFESLGILLAALSGTGKGLEVLSADSHEGIFSALPNRPRLNLTSCRVKGQAGASALGISPPLR